MSECPRCHQSVDSQAIACPYCRMELKAHGHPGIPLYRAPDQGFLCDTCTYHADDSCNFPQRPTAKECTLYHNRLQPRPTAYTPARSPTLQSWLQRNTTLLIVLGLLLISLLIALGR